MASRASQSLTGAQILCLELVARNLTSKEIAAQLGISPHTVDQRIRRSLRTLGAQNRRQAARLISSASSDFRQAAFPVQDPSAKRRDEDCSRPNLIAALDIPLPFATARRPRNTMSIVARLSWIFGIALASFLAMATYLAGLESLARLLRA